MHTILSASIGRKLSLKVIILKNNRLITLSKLVLIILEIKQKDHMNKSELITAVSLKTKLTKSQTETTINELLHIIQRTVSAGEEVKIVGFGSFLKQSRKAKTGRNPKTGETHKIPECSVPRFKPGKEFKDKVAKS